MPVIFSENYVVSVGDRGLTHARIAHSGNWITGAITATSTDPSEIYAAAHPANDALFERWKPAVAGASWEISAPDPAIVDYAVIAAHDLAGVGGGFTVEFWDGSAWRSLATVETAPAGVILVMFPPVTAARFRIVTIGAPAAIGFIRFGRALQMEERQFYAGRTPYALARQSVVTGNQSVQGTFLSRIIVRTGQPIELGWAHLSEAFTTGPLADFLDAIETGPFVIADRPGTHPQDVALCWTVGPRARPSAMGAMDMHSVAFPVEGYVHD